MEVKLLHSTPLWVASTAIRKCWASEGKSDTSEEMLKGMDYYIEEFTTDHSGSSVVFLDVPEAGEKDKALIHRIGNQNKHSSTLEHLTYNFDIDGISRACLQELARHRVASLSVKSTRYTLKELKKENIEDIDNWWCDYCVLTDDFEINEGIISGLRVLHSLVLTGKANDKTKFVLPEAYKTSLVWTINARSLQNFLALRTSKAALWEIRDLANELYNSLPEEHKYLFKEFIYE